jgi:DNA-binding transcriptional LysR family regulator
MANHYPTIKQLDAFCWFARLGTFQAAAAHLCTSQSAIAKRVAELESMMGAKLVDRSGRKSTLTAQGQSLLVSAEDVLAANGRLLATLGQGARYQGKVKLGATELVAMTWLPKLVQAVSAKHPCASIEMEVGPGHDLMHGLREGKIDIVISPGTISDPEFESTFIAAEDFCWLASPSLDLPDGPLCASALAEYPILVYTANGISTPKVNQQLSGIPGKNITMTNTIIVAINLVLSGAGISFLPMTYLNNHLEMGRLRQIKTEFEVQEIQFYATFRRRVPHPLSGLIVGEAKCICDFSLPSWQDLPERPKKAESQSRVETVS